MSPAIQPATPPTTRIIKIDSLFMVALRTEIYSRGREIARWRDRQRSYGFPFMGCYTHQSRGCDHRYCGEAQHERKDDAAILFRQLMDTRSRRRTVQLLGGQPFVPLGCARKS